MPELTQQDLREVAREIKNYVGERVGRVEDQLTRMNGQVRHHGETLAAFGERLHMLEAVEPCEPEPPPDEDTKPALTKRDLKILGGVVVGIGVVIEVAHKALTLLGDAVRLGVK